MAHLNKVFSWGILDYYIIKTIHQMSSPLIFYIICKLTLLWIQLLILINKNGELKSINHCLQVVHRNKTESKVLPSIYMYSLYCRNMRNKFIENLKSTFSVYKRYFLKTKSICHAAWYNLGFNKKNFFSLYCNHNTVLCIGKNYTFKK